jgi:hypothetical protein
VNATLFGRLAGWRRRKDKIGGTVWYMDVQLVGYRLHVAVDNTARGDGCRWHNRWPNEGARAMEISGKLYRNGPEARQS